MKRSFKTWFWSITAVFVLLALAGATYAWFTSNRAVSTSQATARSGEENLELQISSQGGSAFRSEETTVEAGFEHGLHMIVPAYANSTFIRHLRQMIWHPYFKM